jgi:hypothetical protein
MTEGDFSYCWNTLFGLVSMIFAFPVGVLAAILSEYKMAGLKKLLSK